MIRVPGVVGGVHHGGGRWVTSLARARHNSSPSGARGSPPHHRQRRPRHRRGVMIEGGASNATVSDTSAPRRAAWALLPVAESAGDPQLERRRCALEGGGARTVVTGTRRWCQHARPMTRGAPRLRTTPRRWLLVGLLHLCSWLVTSAEKAAALRTGPWLAHRLHCDVGVTKTGCCPESKACWVNCLLVGPRYPAE